MVLWGVVAVHAHGRCNRSVLHLSLYCVAVATRFVWIVLFDVRVSPDASSAKWRITTHTSHPRPPSALSMKLSPANLTLTHTSLL